MADIELIKPRELPEQANVQATDALMVDNGTVVGKATPEKIVNAGAPVASEAEALAGVNNTKRMTPLRVRQVLDNVNNPAVLRAQAWAESSTPPDPLLPDSKSAKTWASIAEQGTVMVQWSMIAEDGQTVLGDDITTGEPIRAFGGVAQISVNGFGPITPEEYSVDSDGVVTLTAPLAEGDVVSGFTQPRLSNSEAQAVVQGVLQQTAGDVRAAQAILDRIDLGALDAAVLSTGTDAETALLAKQASEQAAATAEASAIAADLAKQAAQLSAVATKAFSAPLLADAVTAGIAGTTQGQGFYATGDDVAFIGLYERGSSGAAKRAELPKSAALVPLAKSRSPITRGVSVTGDASGASFSLPSSLGVSAVQAGDTFEFIPPVTNGGAYTITVNGSGPFEWRGPDGLASMPSGAIRGGRLYTVSALTAGGVTFFRSAHDNTGGATRPLNDDSFYYATTEFVSRADNQVRGEIAALRAEVVDASLYPNSVPADIDNYVNGSWNMQHPAYHSQSVVIRDGIPYHALTVSPGSTGVIYLGMDIGQISGSQVGKISVSIDFEATDGNGTTGSTRVLLQFYNGSTEIAASRQSRNFPAVAAVPLQPVSFSGIDIPAGATSIRLVPDAQAGNGSISRTAYVRNVLVAAGASAIYRRVGATGGVSQAVLSSWTILPDMAGGAPTGGFTCTGMDQIRAGAFTGCFAVASDGRDVDTNPSPAFAARIAIMPPDFSRLLASFDLTDMALDGAQGVAFDTSDNSLWVARPGMKRIENYTLSGSENTGKRIDLTGPLWTGAWTNPNGLAYKSDTDQLIVGSASSSTGYVIEKDGEIASTLTLGTSAADQFCYVADEETLYISTGANGANGSVRSLNLATNVTAVVWNGLSRAQAIEGIYVDRAAGRLYVVNDGGFHVAASPALNIGLVYII